MCNIDKNVERRALIVPYFFWFTRGDVFSIGYRLHGHGFVFVGLCIRVKAKQLLANFSTFLVRNILARISVELCSTLYGLCRLNFKFLEYSKKKFYYRSSKLYYLRNKLNTDSWVKY